MYIKELKYHIVYNNLVCNSSHTILMTKCSGRLHQKGRRLRHLSTASFTSRCCTSRHVSIRHCFKNTGNNMRRLQRNENWQEQTWHTAALASLAKVYLRTKCKR